MLERDAHGGGRRGVARKGPPLAPIVHVPLPSSRSTRRRAATMVVTVTVPSKNIDGTMPVDVGAHRGLRLHRHHGRPPAEPVPRGRRRWSGPSRSHRRTDAPPMRRRRERRSPAARPRSSSRSPPGSARREADPSGPTRRALPGCHAPPPRLHADRTASALLLALAFSPRGVPVRPARRRTAPDRAAGGADLGDGDARR